MAGATPLELLLEQELKSLNSQPKAFPRFSEQQVRDRIKANNQEVNLGALGMLANDRNVNEVGGMVFKRALGNRDERTNEQGTYDPLTGEMAESPEYRDAKNEARRDRVFKLALQQEDYRQKQFDKETEAEKDRQLKILLAQLAGSNRIDVAGIMAEARRAAAAAKGENKPGKTLPAGAIEKLSKQQGVAGVYDNLGATFKDDYAGTPLLANAQNTVGRFLGAGYEDQANWWQRYQEQTNAVRNELFGSALTAPEQQAFDRANIVPGMKASEVRRRLSQQARITALGVNRLKERYSQGGYDVADIPEVPVPAEFNPIQPAAPAASAGPKRLKFNPATGMLE